MLCGDSTDFNFVLVVVVLNHVIFCGFVDGISFISNHGRQDHDILRCD